MNEIFRSLAAVWPGMRDILLGPVLVSTIAVGGAILLIIVTRIIAGAINRSKVRRPVADEDDFKLRRKRIVYAVRISIRTTLWAVAGAIILAQVQRILGYTENEKLIEFGKWLAGPGIRIAVTVVLAGLLVWLVNYFSRKVVSISALEETAEEEEKAQRRQTIMHSLRVVINVIIWVLAGLMVLTELGVKVGAIIAGLGVVGVAVGFGAQNLVKDILGGIFIVLEDQMRLGDVVKLGDVTGTVEKISLRTTVIRSLSGHLITVPNGEIKLVENMTHDWSRAIVKVGVGYGSDIDAVISALKLAADDLKSDEELGKHLMDTPLLKAIDNFGDSALDVAMWIKCNPGQQWEVGRIARRYIKERFDAAGIEIPFPQVALTLGQDEAALLEEFARKEARPKGKKE